MMQSRDQVERWWWHTMSIAGAITAPVMPSLYMYTYSVNYNHWIGQVKKTVQFKNNLLELPLPSMGDGCTN